MTARVRVILLATLGAAAVVFAVVQDRVTASGARRYVTIQRQALSGEGPRVTIDEVMKPAVERSVRQGGLWAALVLIAGLGTALVVAGRARGKS